ncbi:MAG: SUMF1/EgtB/PvdO family nonheme iron enzyme [Deltaproteobacteria bacterium]|nr:SUMF1/EgtB/PvdO family nonheme iron enzyme [Deltaproteobacteria bacterium]
METHWDLKAILGAGALPETIICPVDGAEMVLVPKGSFTMGITREELRQIFALDQRQHIIFLTELPARSVDLDAFYIDRYPVTNFQYRKFIRETGHREPMLLNHPDWGKPMQPVVFVGWDDARAYARWAGKSLPNEA